MGSKGEEGVTEGEPTGRHGRHATTTRRLAVTVVPIDLEMTRSYVDIKMGAWSSLGDSSEVERRALTSDTRRSR